MNYRKINNRLIVKILLVAFIICFLPDSVLGDDYSSYHTGLLPPTEEEKKLIEKEWKKIDKVSPNEIAIDRINTKRQEKNLPELNKKEIELIWEDNIDKIKRESDLNSQQLPDYLPYVDNSKLPAFPPIRNQGELPSCVPFSVTYYQLTHMVSLQEGWDNKNEDNHTKFSPKWTYNFINSGELYGTSWYSTYKVLEKHGAATWEEFPYGTSCLNPKNYREWCLNPEIWENAIQYRINPLEYLYISTAEGLEQFKQLLINGYVLIFGTYIFSWQMTDIGDDPSTSDDDEFVGEPACFWMKGRSGYHSMTVVGYNDSLWIDVNQNQIIDSGEKGAFLIANSWGPDWQNNGFAWVAYDALNKVSSVEGGPSVDRYELFKYSRVMLMTVKELYEPSAVAKFTVNHSKRNQMGIFLGISEVNQIEPGSIWVPGSIYFQGGNYAFDGTTTPTDGTFVFDFTDLINTYGNEVKSFYLKIEDNTPGYAATVKDFRVIDYEKGGISYISHEVPQDVDYDSLLVRVSELECDGLEEIIGTWSSGIWYRDLAKLKWTQMYSGLPSAALAAGDFTGDKRADVASIWSSGLWFQNGDSLGWTQVYHTAPDQVSAGDITGDGVDEIIGCGGAWDKGVWYRDVANGTWHHPWSGPPADADMAGDHPLNETPDGPIAAGDVTGDGKGDMISCWKSGLWYQDGATLSWTKVWKTAPSKVTCGDVTGDGQAELIGYWDTGIWYRDEAESKWTKMYSFNPDIGPPIGDMAAGDFTGDGKADVASCWTTGLWFQNGATLGWKKVWNEAPYALTAGDVTGVSIIFRKGLTAYYPFNGNANDESGNGYNGIVNGDSSLSEDRFGNSNSAYYFDGDGDYIDVGTELNITGWENYATSVWFLNDGGGDWSRGYGQMVINKTDWYKDFWLSVGEDGSLSFCQGSNFKNCINDKSKDYRDNQWHHVVINNRHGDIELWIDNELFEITYNVPFVYNNKPLLIGYSLSGDGYQRKYWSGKIDDILIYNRALSEAEIKALYNPGN